MYDRQRFNDVPGLSPDMRSSEPAALPPPLQPYSLAHLIAWLEKMPAYEEYNWDSCYDCLLAQYAKSIGYCGKYSPYSHACDQLVACYGHYVSSYMVCAIAQPDPLRFGAALDRAKRFQHQYETKLIYHG